jgi:hypothetical protein
VRSAELQARADRLLPIPETASARALDHHGKKFAKLAGSEKLHRQFELIDALSDEDFAMFLDILEAGVPDVCRDMLQPRDDEAAYLKALLFRTPEAGLFGLCFSTN